MSWKKRYLQIIYSFWSIIYDSLIDWLFSFNRKKPIHQLQIKKGDKILEIGVGTGLNLPLYPKSCKVLGIDFSKSMLNKAKKKNSKADVSLSIMDARQLSCKTNSFDKAFMTYVLRVSPEPKKIMQELQRVIKPRGTCVIIDQFKEGNLLLLSIMQPFKLLLGWGKEPDINKIIKGTSWQIKKTKQMGKMIGTKMIILKNTKTSH